MSTFGPEPACPVSIDRSFGPWAGPECRGVPIHLLTEYEARHVGSRLRLRDGDQPLLERHAGEDLLDLFHVDLTLLHSLLAEFIVERVLIFRGDIEDTRYYLIYWTCMQLECDIIAELNLQQSEISKYEQPMPTPNLQHMIECGIDQRVAYSYHAQIWLLKTLNNAHTMLYGPNAENCQGMQEGFDTTDPLNELLDPNDKTVLGIADRGINALIHSTKAFHNLPERRYIVTNIFGTVQASRYLSHFIDPEELKSLFDKIIQFLEVVSHRSSALEVGGKILIGLRDSLFPTGFSRPETLPTISPNPPHNPMAPSVFHPLSMSLVHNSPIGPPSGLLGNIHLGS
ncbi:hypothetical protein MCOR02_012391 [Pyricularia oryzae]|nr:hypothetical protein MCOR02_012391 [Pyricularia oryzae]